MQTILKHLQDPKFTAKLHLWLMALWVVLIIPTFLWWSESIFWVLLISIYANVASHWSAYQGVKAEESNP